MRGWLLLAALWCWAGVPLVAGDDWRARVLAKAWELLEDCPPKDAAALLRLVKDVEQGEAGPSSGAVLDQLEAKRARRRGRTS